MFYMLRARFEEITMMETTGRLEVQIDGMPTAEILRVFGIHPCRRGGSRGRAAHGRRGGSSIVVDVLQELLSGVDESAMWSV